MIGLILFIIALVLVMGIAPYVLDEKGYMLISFNNTTIEGTLIGFCGSIIIVLGLLYVLYKLVRYLWSIYSNTKHRFFARGQERKQIILEQALFSVINDDFDAVGQALAKNSVPSEYKDIRLALLAKTALVNKQPEKALEYLFEITPEQQLKVAKLWIASGDSRVIEPQIRAQAESKKATELELKVYAEVLIQQHRWDELGLFLPRLLRKNSLSESQWHAIFKPYFSAFNTDELTIKYQHLAKKLQPLARFSYLQAMIKSGLIADIEPMLIKLLKQQQYDDLAILLVDIRIGEAPKLYASLQEYLKKNDENTPLLLALACLANARGEYELASRVFDKALTADNKVLYKHQAVLSYSKSQQPDKALILCSN
jgi:HemY protein